MEVEVDHIQGVKSEQNDGAPDPLISLATKEPANHIHCQNAHNQNGKNGNNDGATGTDSECEFCHSLQALIPASINCLECSESINYDYCSDDIIVND